VHVRRRAHLQGDARIHDGLQQIRVLAGAHPPPEAGGRAQVLTRGDKACRRHFVESLPPLIHSLRLVVLCGQTGTAKTRTPRPRPPC